MRRMNRGCDTVTWELIGERTVEGKANVVATCEESSRALADLDTRFVQLPQATDV